jgi:aminoglycoside adenylyltransferase-like protein
MDPALDAYLGKVAVGLARALGPALAGLYLHGSAALGGWSAERSDVDLLGVVARRLGRRPKLAVAARLLHPALACPGRGLELSLVTASVAAAPPRRPPFELHVTTAPPQPGSHLGGPGATDPDLLLHFAVCRRSGVAVTGAPPEEVFDEPPRAWLLERAAAELRWAARHGSFADQVLNACRAWRLLKDGELCSKLDGGEWARARADPALVDAALAARRGLAPMPDAAADLAAAVRFVAAVLDRFPEAGRRGPGNPKGVPR